jgi:hypothetical protein
MTAFRKFVPLLLALALIAGSQAAAFAGVLPTPDCPTLSNAGDDDGCCSDNSTSACEIACGMSLAAVDSAEQAIIAKFVGAPLERDSDYRGLMARPPDTAPPKSLPA